MLVGTPTVCRTGVSCVTQYINWYGFITIPFLAMIAFFFITLFSLIALTSGEPTVDGRKSPPWIQVLGILAVIGGIFYYLFQTGAPPTSSLALSQLPGGEFTPVATPLAAASDAQDPETSGEEAVGQEFLAGADLEQGAQHYQNACAACHGLDGQGALGLGNNLLTADSVQRQDPRETLALVREGILANDPNNQTGVAMPPSGGRPELSDADILAIIAHLRNLSTAQE
jgi:disulfide bond formation protein DsbB